MNEEGKTKINNQQGTLKSFYDKYTHQPFLEVPDEFLVNELVNYFIQSELNNKTFEFAGTKYKINKNA